MGNAASSSVFPHRGMKLNLACGKDKEEGWIGVDHAPLCHPDRVGNILTAEFWDTIPDDSVDEMRTWHFLEHIPHVLPDAGTTEGLFWFMARAWRALKPGGTINIRYPHHHHDGSYSDPTHTRFIGPHTLWYMSRPWLNMNGLGHYVTGCDFDIAERSEQQIHPPWAKMKPEEISRAMALYWNVCFEVRMTLVAVKPCRE